MTRIPILRLRIMAMAVTAGVLALAGTALAAHAAGGTRVKLAKTGVGTILVNARGRTLYVFARDRRNHDACVKIPDCTSFWPPVKTKGSPVAGPGIKRSLLGSIKLPGGARQLTYAGHPLYTFTSDQGPRETGYIGFNQSGGRWYAITASGHVIK